MSLEARQPDFDPPHPVSGSGFDGDALSRLRRELIWTLGERRAHGVLARVGLSRGHADYLEKPGPLATAPLGWGQLRAVDHKSILPEVVFELNNSVEAREHMRFFGRSHEPQCWLTTGYLTGFSRFAGESPIYFIETRCAAMGEPVCRFVGKKRSKWASTHTTILSQFDEDNMSAELADTREALRAVRDRYQNFFEQASVAIVIVHPETGVYLESNVAASDLTGYTHDELSQMNVFDLRPKEEHHEAANNLKAVAAGEPISNNEMTVVRKDGHHLKILQSSKALMFEGEKVIQVAMRDITDLKLSEQKERDLYQQLIRSERLSSIGRLAAGVAHELKNPLGAIKNAVYYIRSALLNTEIVENDPSLKEILALAESEIDSSVRIIGELLDFSRVVELIPRTTQVNSLLENLPHLVPIPENIRLNMELDITLPSAQVDPDRLKQVFSNIAGNAVQAMPHGGTLTIRSQFEIETSDEGEQKEFIIISFEDTGKGIEPVHLKKIFEPLFTTKARGTGLGLAISGNIVEKHGGVIQVTSQAGKGATFRVKLPLRAPNA